MSTRLVSSRRIFALLGVTLVLLLAPEIGVAWSAPLASFRFQAEGAPPLLVLRVGVLVFVLSALVGSPQRAVVAAALFVVSLAACGALYPFLLGSACLLGLGAHRRPPTDPTAFTVLYVSLMTALALVAVPHLRHPTTAPDTGDPPRVVAYWLGRRNPYQARFWTLVWTRGEANAPGDGYLTLATIDHELGRDVQAKKVLAKVLDHPATGAVRARAESLQTAWDREPQRE